MERPFLCDKNNTNHTDYYIFCKIKSAGSDQ